MRVKRIIAGLLSFILMMGNPLTVLANPVNTVSQNEVLEEVVSTTVSENGILTETEDTVSENGVDSSGSITAEEILPLPDMDVEQVPVEEIPFEYLEITQEAQVDLQSYLDEKDIFALVYLTNSYDVKNQPSAQAQTVLSVPSAKTVQILGMDVEWEYSEEWEEYIPSVWYETQFYDGETLYSGYIEDSFLAYSDEKLLQWKDSWFMLFPGSVSMYATTDSYADINLFPTSYRSALRKLKDAHPNWTFVPMNVNRNWDVCVTEQAGTSNGDPYSWIYYNQPANFRGEKISSTWYRATREAIEYYMDPRNFLNETYIFQFEQNSFNKSYHTTDALDLYFKGSFMEGVVPDDSEGRTYSEVFYEVGANRGTTGISPFFLAAKVMLEQGKSGSQLVSGTYPGYEKLYNFFNIGASGTGTTAVVNGLTYARKQGWTTRYKSIAGGAESYGKSYILKGQDTLYLQKFDLIKSRGYLFQYQQNIMAPSTDGKSVKSMYSSSGALNSAFVFKIPVFNNMPNDYKFTMNTQQVELVRGKEGKENYTLIVNCNGSAVTDGMLTFKSDNEKVAIVSSAGVISAVGSGETTIHISVKYDDMDEAETFECKVKVLSPLQDILLNLEKQDLFMGDDLPEKIAYLDENGVTQYTDEIPSQVTLNVSYNPVDTTDSRKVTWTVENKDIVSIEEQGENSESVIVTAKNFGTTTVSAIVGGITKTVEINVRIPMTQAALKQNELTLYKGQTTQIPATYAPYNTSDRVEVVWTSENENVVEVDSSGKIVAKGAGTTKLHAAIGPFDGSQSELTVDVTVEEYTVTFMNADGTLLLSAAGEYGKSLERLVSGDEAEIPWMLEKEDYYFIGWYTGENGSGNLVTQNTILYADMVLYPYFVSNESTEPYVKPIGSVTYTGAYIKPDVKVYNADVLLVKGMDYTLSYQNNKAVNDGSNPEKMPTVIITGKGQYVGWETTHTFKIVPKSLLHVDITVPNLSAEYTGNVQKLRPSVSDRGRALQYNKDYKLEYVDTTDGAYKEAGTYAIKITGIGNYTGEREAYITISKRVIMEDVSISVVNEVKYNNGKPYTSDEELEACRPAVKVKYNGNTLLENTDYILVYENNKDIGTASVTVVGQGAYIGSHTLYFKITGTQISTVMVSGISDKEYTGEAIIQNNLVVTDKSKNVLQEGLDYEIAYKNNVKTGKASIVLTGIHGYTGSITKTFTIEPYDIAKNSLTYEAESGSGENLETRPAFEAELLTEEAEYDKAGVKPEVAVTFKGVALKEGTDYKVSYENNYSVSDESTQKAPAVIITGKGLFTGSVTKTFTITEKNIAKVNMTAKDVTFRNRQGFCFVEPVLTDESGRRLKAGSDYESELIYTYAEDVVLYDGTVRLAGEPVLDTDIPTPGELKDAKITVTAKGTGNYTGEISATYAILENTSWFDDLFKEEETPRLKINRTVLYLNPVYPEMADSVKLGVENGTLLTDKTTVVYKPIDSNKNEEIGALFDVILEEGKLTLKLNKAREELAEILPDGNYVFVITPVAEIEGTEITLAERTVTVRIYRNEPIVDWKQSGSIDLLFRDTTAVEVEISLESEVDSLIIPQNQSDMDAAYYLSGEDALNYRLVYERSEFVDDYHANLRIQAVENSFYVGESNTGSEQLAPGEMSDVKVCCKTAMGFNLSSEVQIALTQSEYKITPYTSTCYVKQEDGKGKLVFSSTQPVIYNRVSCSDENVSLTVSGRTLYFEVKDAESYQDGKEIPVTVSMYAKGAGKGTSPYVFDVKLLICADTKLEYLLSIGDTEEMTLEERQKLMTSYEETKRMSLYNRNIIRANNVDFSNISIAFLGDSITEGVGLEKVGIEPNVYTSVVERSLNAEAVYRFGYGGYAIGRHNPSVSLYSKYTNIPADTDIIFVQGGINDVYSGSEATFGSLSILSQTGTFCADTYALMCALQADYPDAQIIFLTPLSTVTNESYKDMLPDMLEMSRYVSAMKAIAEKEELANVEVWDLYNTNILNSFDKDILREYMYDGVHPGIAGHRVLGEYIASRLIRQRSGYIAIKPEEAPDVEYVTPLDFWDENETDHTAAFNEAITVAHDNNMAVYVPEGTYRINADIGIKLKSGVDIIMSPNAVIKALGSAINHSRVFELYLADDVTITGGQIIGERYHHIGTGGEWGMGIRIYDCKNVTISDVTISNCWGDGIYIGAEDEDVKGAGCDKITIDNCYLYNNRRNNLSIVCGRDITVRHCTFENAHGTAPGYGIDIEPNYPHINQCQRIWIHDCVFAENEGGSMAIITSSDTITISDCEMDGMFINYAGTNVNISNTCINGEMNARYGVTIDEKSVINDGTAKEDVLVASLSVDKDTYTFLNYQIDGNSPMTAEIIADDKSLSGKAVRLKRTAEGNKESGFYLKVSEFDIPEGFNTALESGETYRFEYVMKGNGFWGIKTNQTAWYPCMLTEEYRTGFTTYKAKSANTCNLLLYACDKTKDMHMEVNSIKIYKVQ